MHLHAAKANAKHRCDLFDRVEHQAPGRGIGHPGFPRISSATTLVDAGYILPPECRRHARPGQRRINRNVRHGYSLKRNARHFLALFALSPSIIGG
jgi:hypothetical protein